MVDGILVLDRPSFRDNPSSGKAPEILIGSNSREGLSAPDTSELEATLESAFGPNVAEAKEIYGYGRNEADPVLGTPADQFWTPAALLSG